MDNALRSFRESSASLKNKSFKVVTRNNKKLFPEDIGSQSRGMNEHKLSEYEVTLPGNSKYFGFCDRRHRLFKYVETDLTCTNGVVSSANGWPSVDLSQNLEGNGS